MVKFFLHISKEEQAEGSSRLAWTTRPGDRKCYRNSAILTVLDEVTAELDPQFPAKEPGLHDIVIS